MFDSQPMGLPWKFNEQVEHLNVCFDHCLARPSIVNAHECEPPYLPGQVARLLLEEEEADPNINEIHIAAMENANFIYCRQLPTSHFRSVRRELLRYRNAWPAVDMVALGG